VLLVVEDLHWIDTETQALLDGLIESLATAPLLLLVNYRPEYRHGWGGKTYYTQLRLDPLAPEDATQALDALVGVDPGLAALKQSLIDRTEGNPFFLEESVRTMVETGALVGERGAYRLARASQAVQVPATVQAVLAARIDRLDPEEKALLQTAAVIGKDVPLSLLRATVDEPEDALLARLARLQAAEFLYETTAFPDPEHTFKHALTLEIAYNGLLQDRRRALHARVLEGLERETGDGPGEHVERLAHHALRAERWDRAAAYLYQAGEKAFAYGAHASAAPFYEAVIDAVDRLGDRGDRTLKLDACLELWAVRINTGQMGGIEALAETVEALATALDDRPRLAKVRVAQAQASWLFPSGTRSSGTAIERAREASRLADPADLRTRSYAQVVAGASLRDVGDFRASILEYDRGATLFESVELAPDVRGLVIPIYAILRSFRVDSLGALGEFDRAIASGEEGLRAAREIGHSSTLAIAHAFLGYAHLMRGEIDPSLALCRAGLGIAEESSMDPSFTATNALHVACALSLSGEREQAAGHLERARQVGGAVGPALLKFTKYGAVAATALLALDRVAEAQAEVDENLMLVAVHDARGHEAPLLRLRAEVLDRRAPEHAEEARLSCERGLALARELGMRPEMAHCRRVLSRLHRHAGDGDGARVHLDAAIALFSELGMPFWAARAETEASEDRA
jgi:tetratricopeptide (TPR) repeat protein